MMHEDQIAVGVLGTAVSAIGTGLSVTDMQAIISIIVMMLYLLVDLVSTRRYVLLFYPPN